jgi:membrane protein required for beta-lactamase induction
VDSLGIHITQTSLLLVAAAAFAGEMVFLVKRCVSEISHGLCSLVCHLLLQSFEIQIRMLTHRWRHVTQITIKAIEKVFENFSPPNASRAEL